MFNPLENEILDEWFQRFNAPMKRLPAEERAVLNLEVRQHLEALVAANEELGSSPQEAWEHALQQFGDPTRIGRKMYQEWRQGKMGFCADMSAILFGLGLQAMRGVLVQWLLNSPNGTSHPDALLLWMLGFPMTAIIGISIGRKYPHQAIKGALLWPFLWPVGAWIAIATAYKMGWTQISNGEALPLLVLHIILYNGTTFFLSCVTAYLASMTKRGWYRPSLADFKLTLPRRRPQVSR